ncbi:hypothetical protein SASPL_101904 [Salvia splendens]|uniref:SWIM-type domain-containing protein n=1 Tax=Salvia splendens TaxID=180675 RepID=A0A8X9ABM7_SALSN|nr:hypothetical protein SASPL_101904 [Salvia splendens]
MNADLADSDIDINLDELDGILTFEDSDNDLTDDININDLNDGMDAISLHVDLGRDDRGSEYDGMDAISLYDEILDKEDEIWVEDEAQESVFNEMENIHSSDSDEERRTMWHVFNAERDMKNPKFHHGMLFTNKEVLKQTIKQYGIVNKYNVKVVRDEKDRINAKCLNGEGWMIRASINKKENALQIKKLKDNHRCAAEIPQKYITYKWLSETYREHLRADPKLSSKSMAHQLEVDFKAKTGRLKLWRAKKHALEKLRRSEAEQYGKLRDYAEELKKTNPNSSQRQHIKLNVSRRMALIKKEDIKAWEWLFNKPPQNWSKSHFRDFSKCDILLNNHSESFNSYILEARDQPILTMLEEIRMKLMKRMCMKKKVAEKYIGSICPKIVKKLEKYKGLSSNCWATEAGARKYSVAIWEKIYVVDLEAWTCSCRQWQLYGIPCQHTIPCILQERRNPEEFVHGYYTVDRFKAAYEYVINPLRDIDDYEPSGYLPVQPPPVNPKKGRMQKRRRKTIDEQICKVATDGTKIVANTRQIKGNCSKCGGQGHNKRTCGRQISDGGAREEHREESVSTLERRSKLTVRRKMTSISQEPQNITSQLPKFEN